ncbi:MAG: hypothetical protein E6J91_07795 [Deltaproteobacteria bacterium]|nr:MAG: hypothetical protein E6J91_07795 [Deltaproteobacteria bacterium]
MIAVLALPFVAYRLIARTTWLERLVARMASRRFSALPYLQSSAAGDRGPRPVPFPVSLAVLTLAAAALIIAAASGALAMTIDFHGRVSTSVGMVVSAVGMLVALASLVVHWASSQVRWRQLKYELMAGGWGLLIMGAVLDISAEAQISGMTLEVREFGSVAIPIAWQSAASLLGVPALFLVLGIATHAAARRMASREAGYRRTLRLHRWITPLGKLAVLLFIIPVHLLFAVVSYTAAAAISSASELTLLVYIFMRFELKRALWAHPILYLRSFHNDAALSAFARIVAPVAARYGVLIGLVHAAQPRHVLQGQVATLDRGGFVEASDEEWRAWVKRSLAACQFVVIDVSALTGNVAWELQAALDAVGPARALVMEHREPPGEATEQSPCRLYYSNDRKRRRTARRALDRWFSAAAGS